jgi:hypothetical protein
MTSRVMKIFGLFLIFASVSILAGCQAFDSNAGEPMVDKTVSKEPPEEDKTDYSIDATECATPAEVTVKGDLEGVLVANAGWTSANAAEGYTVTATKVSDFTTAIKIEKAIKGRNEVLAMTLKRTGTYVFSACNISLTNSSGRSLITSGGEISVDSFAKDGKINAGSYNLRFSQSAAVVKEDDNAAAGATTRKDAKAEGDKSESDANASASSASSVAGAYHVGVLSEPVAEESSEKEGGEEKPEAAASKAMSELL